MNNDELQAQLLAEFGEYATDNDGVNTDTDDSENHNEINPTSLIIISIIWVEGLRAGSRLAWASDELCLYYRNGTRKLYDADAYTCSQNDCNARIFVSKKDGKCFKDHRSPNHEPHGSMGYRT